MEASSEKEVKELCSFEEKLTDLISSFSEMFLVSSYNCRETGLHLRRLEYK